MASPMQGKVVAITGGASGIGLATAKILSTRGATVCIADITLETLKTTETYFTEHHTSFMITKVDVTKSKDVEDWFHAIMAKFGHLDGAVNAAGIIGRTNGKTTLTELEDDEWMQIITVNLTGTMYCLRAALRHVTAGGSIVNVASIHGIKGFTHTAAYDASKHGVVGLTRAAALENGAREVRVNAVAPGVIYTPMVQKAWDILGRPKDAPFDVPSAIERMGKPEEVGEVIAFLLSPESKFVTGSVYSVDGGWI